MKNLPFIQELTEARMFTNKETLHNMSAEEIGEIVYLIFMLVEVIRWNHNSKAESYAQQTTAYYPYSSIEYSGTDLGNLLAVLNNQGKFKDFIKMDGGVSMPLFLTTRYLKAVKDNSDATKSEDQRFFWKLEDYLKVYRNPTLRQLRRDIGNWTSLKQGDKIRVIQLLRRELDKKASNIDLYLWFKQSFRLVENSTHTKPIFQETDNVAWFKEMPEITVEMDTKLEYHDTLNPKLWDEDEDLDIEVKNALAKIANKFAEYIDISQMKIVDYIITGSNCAYNYTPQSDIDLHILIDASKLGDNPLIEPLLIAKKTLWNSEHPVTIKGYTVEVYAQNISSGDELVASGVYSLLQDKWLIKPKKLKIAVNDIAIVAKADAINAQIYHLISSKTTDVNEIDKLLAKIYKMRRAGLSKCGEFSVENLAFKALRNNGAITDLFNYKNLLINKDLTL